MKLTILSPEESKIEWERRRKENSFLFREQVQDWAMQLPKSMVGNTDYIVGDENWNKFYEWILTDEGYEQWQKDLDMIDYIKSWNEKYGR